MPELRPQDTPAAIPPAWPEGDGLETALRVLARIIARQIQGTEEGDDLTSKAISALLDDPPR